MPAITEGSSRLVSVIVSCFNQIELTRFCIASLLRHTSPPWELIVIDDGSTDGTSDFLREIQGVPGRVKIITNREHRGHPIAWDQGLKEARGEYLAILHSDVVVTDAWLDQLIALAESDSKIGLVGPMSNQDSLAQQVYDASYADLDAMHEFAASWRTEHRGQWIEVGELASFCWLIKRQVLMLTDGLNEQLGPGIGFDDLSARARRAGFTLAVAHDLYVHRFGARATDRDSVARVWERVARVWHQIPGMFDFEKVYDAAVEAAEPGAVFVEVGCLAGRSTCYLGSKIRATGKGITLYAVDPATGSPSDATGQVIAPAVGGSLAGVLHRNILGCGLEEYIVPILTTSVRAASLFPDEAVDFCFIDGDHSYESVTADLKAWWPKIRPGGTLAGHDYRQKAPWLLGLTPAVHDFFQVVDATHPALPSCWAMVKGPPQSKMKTDDPGTPTLGSRLHFDDN